MEGLYGVLKLSENPPALYPEVGGIKDVRGTWWVAHARPRQEKALAWDVLNSGGGYYLPMYEAVRRSARRSWKTMLLLFPGYVFLCGDADHRQRALESDRIAHAIPVPDQTELVAELSAIRRVLVSKRGFDPYDSLAKSTACRVRRGPLAGLNGRVVRRKNRTRFVLTVTILGQGVAVEIDADMLEPC